MQRSCSFGKPSWSWEYMLEGEVLELYCMQQRLKLDFQNVEALLFKTM